MSDLATNIIAVLADGQFHTGDALGLRFGVSKTSVWKAINRLDDYGLDVHSVRGKGYRLSQPLTMLDETVIRSWLSADTNSQVRHVAVLPEIDSTNSYLLRQVQSGMHEADSSAMQVCLSEMQSAGKGRRGREWVSPFGQNIYMSVLKQFEGGAAALSGLSLVVGLAVSQALSQWSVADIGLKWPNDIYCRGQKVGGVLLEVSGDLQSRCQVVIGLGLNVVANYDAMKGVDQPWTDLASHGFNPANRNLLVARILEALSLTLERFQAKGFAGFVDDWQEVDLSRGQLVQISGSGEPVEGTGLGVDASGALLLDTAEGVMRFHGGEVSLRLRPDAPGQ